ncbi:MAG: hypothetical protein MSIBF_05390 [Candidatus Altiarchaeales archaeon IMC4]|nr:MAG: hypothetical protein MSIBF_05390 [Candidatus Altiarchaeales archaeon IMC4]
MELQLTAVLRKEDVGGYSSVCPELEVASQGETVDEAIENLKEATELYLEGAKELGVLNEKLSEAGIEIKEGCVRKSPVLTTPIHAVMPA